MTNESNENLIKIKLLNLLNNRIRLLNESTMRPIDFHFKTYENLFDLNKGIPNE